MKTVLVTGGGGEIGAGICRKFAENGYAVIATYRSDRAKAEGLLAALPGSQHRIFEAPTTDAAAVVDLQAFVAKHYGKLDVLVNNAGITTPVAHHDLDGLTDEWIDKIMQTNFRGSFAMVRSFKDLLRASATANQVPALVVNISSIAATFGIGSNVAYCASKAAVDSMTRSLARALAPDIRMVSVSPGWVLGEYTKEVDPAYLQMQKDLTPLAKLATASDVADTVFALATYLTFTTGSIIPVDGGRTLGK